MPYEYKSGLAEDIIAYLALRSSLGYSIELYARHLRDLDAFCGENYPKDGVLTKPMATSWVELREKESIGTQHIRASIVRTLGRFQSSEGRPAYVLPEGITGHTERYVPYILSDDELAALFTAIDTLPPQPRCPDRDYILPVLFRMMLCCGLRPGEPLRLERNDIDYDRAMLVIKDTKRHKNRLVVMSGDMLDLCARYDDHAGTRKLFFEHPNGGEYSRRWPEYQLKTCLKACGLAGLPVRPYDFRHRFASTVIMRWADEGRDVAALLPRLAGYMGHTEIRDTLYYVHLLQGRISVSPGIDWSRFSDLYPGGFHENS